MKKLLNAFIISALILFPFTQLAGVPTSASLGNIRLQTIRGGEYYFHLALFLPRQTAPVQVKARVQEPAQVTASLRGGRTILLKLTALTDLEVEVKGPGFLLNRFYLKRELEGLEKQWRANILWGRYLEAKKAGKGKEVLKNLFQEARVAYQELEPYQPGYAKGALRVLEKEENRFLKKLLVAETSVPTPQDQPTAATPPPAPAPVVQAKEATPSPSPVAVTPAPPQNVTPQPEQPAPLPSSLEEVILEREVRSLKEHLATLRGEMEDLRAFLDQPTPLYSAFTSPLLWDQVKGWFQQDLSLSLPSPLFLFSLVEGVLVALLIFALLYLLMGRRFLPAGEVAAGYPMAPQETVEDPFPAVVRDWERFRTQVQQRFLSQERQLRILARAAQQMRKNLEEIRSELTTMQGNFGEHSREIEHLKKFLSSSPTETPE
ncbi:MAG: hypothetical protein D6736_20025 [Nitrospinota bacterium]|nr:MAG: hypothetical protein D6736_20025 [Nitrospinota bacterium]